LPEGTVVDLVGDDEGDDLTDEQRRAALHEVLSASWNQLRQAGFDQRRQFWTNCASSGDAAGPNHS
jgi:hypothetical protein